MQDRKLTPEMVPVIKLARERGYNYALIAAHYKINQGRIAESGTHDELIEKGGTYRYLVETQLV